MEHKHENCNGGLLPASNILDCYVCIKCGYVSTEPNKLIKNGKLVNNYAKNKTRTRKTQRR